MIEDDAVMTEQSRGCTSPVSNLGLLLAFAWLLEAFLEEGLLEMMMLEATSDDESSVASAAAS